MRNASDTQTSHIPATREEMRQLGWNRPDIILVTGDAHVDSPYIGAAVIARVLLAHGYRVAMIAQPDIHDGADITRLGEPTLFWGVSGGSLDSMVANYTALGKPRRKDDLTPGGLNTRRPDRAVVVYSNLIRRFFKRTVPIVLGGVEASLRRISHVDAWSNSVRRAIVFDAKAEYLVYGMGERTVVELAAALRGRQSVHAIRGLCYISSGIPPEVGFEGPDVLLPDHETVARDPAQFSAMFKLFYANNHPRTARRLLQRQDTRYLVHNPPQAPLEGQALDAVYELGYTRHLHPYYHRLGTVPALATIRFGLTTHRGCYGECRFCAIAVHQGVQVTSRSQESLLREASSFNRHPLFKGIISDVGGPTANMYGLECRRKQKEGPCPGKNCLFPAVCPGMPLDHGAQIELLRALRALPGIRKVFIGSGLRYDMILRDRANGVRYLEEILRWHVSGQLKIAPEHCVAQILELMGKPGGEPLEAFIDLVGRLNAQTAHKTYLTYYLMAAHPGCTLADMRALGRYALNKLGHVPEQVQIFTPTPSTFSTLMYHTGCHPFTGQPVFVEKNPARKQEQKNVLKGKSVPTARQPRRQKNRPKASKSILSKK